MALDTKAFTEGFYEGHKNLGSPKKHEFRTQSPEKHMSKKKFNNYEYRTKSLIKRMTSSVAWEESSFCSSVKKRSLTKQTSGSQKRGGSSSKTAKSASTQMSLFLKS